MQTQTELIELHTARNEHRQRGNAQQHGTAAKSNLKPSSAWLTTIQNRINTVHTPLQCCARGRNGCQFHMKRTATATTNGKRIARTSARRERNKNKQTSYRAFNPQFQARLSPVCMDQLARSLLAFAFLHDDCGLIAAIAVLCGAFLPVVHNSESNTNNVSTQRAV